MPRRLPCHVLAAVLYYSDLPSFGLNLQQLHNSVHDAQEVCPQLNCFVFGVRDSNYFSTRLRKAVITLLGLGILHRGRKQYLLRRKQYIKKAILSRYNKNEQEYLKCAGVVLKEQLSGKPKT